MLESPTLVGYIFWLDALTIIICSVFGIGLEK
jgi:hypothetical protein